MLKWVKDLVENQPSEYIQGEIKLGSYVWFHPKEGMPYMVEITKSHYWGQYGLSNWFEWINLVTKEKENGYGFFTWE